MANDPFAVVAAPQAEPEQAAPNAAQPATDPFASVSATPSVAAPSPTGSAAPDPFAAVAAQQTTAHQDTPVQATQPQVEETGILGMAYNGVKNLARNTFIRPAEAFPEIAIDVWRGNTKAAQEVLRKRLFSAIDPFADPNKMETAVTTAPTVPVNEGKGAWDTTKNVANFPLAGQFHRTQAGPIESETEDWVTGQLNPLNVALAVATMGGSAVESGLVKAGIAAPKAAAIVKYAGTAANLAFLTKNGFDIGTNAIPAAETAYKDFKAAKTPEEKKAALDNLKKRLTDITLDSLALGLGSRGLTDSISELHELSPNARAHANPDYSTAVHDYVADKQLGSGQAEQLHRESLDAVKDPLQREAISNRIEAEPPAKTAAAEATATEARKAIPSERLPEGSTEDIFHIHEQGHAHVAAKNGIGGSVITHEHPLVVDSQNAGGFLANDTPLISQEGAVSKYSPEELLSNTKKWLESYMGGAAADDVINHIKLADNKGVGGDFQNGLDLLAKHGITGEEATDYLAEAYKAAKERFTPEAVDIIKTNTQTREAGLPETQHTSVVRQERIAQQIQEAENAKADTIRIQEADTGRVGDNKEGSREGGRESEKATAKPFKYEPLNVAEPTTGKTFYHGTRESGLTNIEELHPSKSSSTNLFGPGAYLTDSAEVAGRYGQRGAVLQGKLGDLKLIDLEAPADPRLVSGIKAVLPKEEFKAVQEAAGKDATGKDLYSAFRNHVIEAHGGDVLPDYQYDLIEKLGAEGSHGFRYEGTKLGTTPDNALVLFGDVLNGGNLGQTGAITNVSTEIGKSEGRGERPLSGAEPTGESDAAAVGRGTDEGTRGLPPQAGGLTADQILEERAKTSEANPDTKDFAEGYRAAKNLSPEAETLRGRLTGVLQDWRNRLIERDLMTAGRENYIPHKWTFEDTDEQGQPVEVTPSTPRDFLKGRTFDSFHQGEQAGFEPTTKDAAKLASDYVQKASAMVAKDDLAHSLLEGKTAAGEPLAVKASQMSDPAFEKYQRVDLSASNGKGLGRDTIAVHPDIAQDLNAVLSKPGASNFFLKLSQQAKGTILSLSPFHAAMESVLAAESGVNPFGRIKESFFTHLPENVDYYNLTSEQAQAIKDGVNIMPANNNYLAEGETAGGKNLLINKLPFVGDMNRFMHERLFGSNGMITGLKFDLYNKLKPEIMEKFPDLSEEQAGRLAATQVNNKFGGLNYELLGRDAGNQKILRGLLLAPDFLESRGRSIMDVAGSHGTPLAQRLLAFNVAHYLTARAINYLVSGDTHPEAGFSVLSKDGKKEYGIRTTLGDFLHFAEQPGSYVQNRINPVVRVGNEVLTGRDLATGQKVSNDQKLWDALRQVIPIPLQALTPKQTISQPSAVDDLLKSAGVQSKKVFTPAETLAMQRQTERNENGEPLAGEQLEHAKKKSEMRQKLSDAIQSQDTDQIYAAAKEITDAAHGPDAILTLKQAKELKDDSRQYPHRLQYSIHRLPLADSLDVYAVASQEERKLIQKEIQKKIVLWGKTGRSTSLPRQWDAMLPKIIQFENDGQQPETSDQ